MNTENRVPVSDTVVELEFAATSPSIPCVAATNELGGRFELEEFVPRGDGGYAEFYRIEGIHPDQLLEFAQAHEESEAQFLSRSDDGGLLEMHVTGDCPARKLAELGALPRYVGCVDGVCRIISEVPPQYDATELTPQFLDAYPDAELVAKTQKSYFTPLFSHRELDQAVETRLTDRQQEVLSIAHERGYYEWPRQVTQEELAEELGISAPTLTQHLRAAEQKLITLIFEDGTRRADPMAEMSRAE